MENGKNIIIYPSEYRFCQILWENEPVTTTQPVKLCRDKLNWAKSTTFTVIRRLASRGFIKKRGHCVVRWYQKQQFVKQIQMLNTTEPDT